MDEELQHIEKLLREKEWRWHVTQVIAEIPSGYLATYGCIAEFANHQYDLNIIPRNVAWLRKYLYGLLTHETQVPLHRLSKVGDVKSLADSEKTKSYNDNWRGEEGSLENTRWWDPFQTP